MNVLLIMHFTVSKKYIKYEGMIKIQIGCIAVGTFIIKLLLRCFLNFLLVLILICFFNSHSRTLASR